VHDAVRRRRGIAAGDTGRKPMPRRNDAAGAKRRGDRRLQSLRQGENLRPRLRGGSPVAGDDRDATGSAQCRGGALDIRGVGHRPVRRDMPLLGVEHRRLGGLAELDLIALMTREIEMGRPWRIGQRGAPGVAQQARQLGGRIDRGRKLRHRREERCMRDLLIGVAVLE